MERYEQLADAYQAVASANHYMIGIVEPYTDDELDQAKQELIMRQNAVDKVLDPEQFAVLDLALELIEQDHEVRNAQ